MTELKETDLDPSPIVQFERWFAEARERQPDMPEAMCVATCGADGVVSARVCLLKAFDAHGFVFFTNYGSRKGDQIRENPHVALSFFWRVLDRQKYYDTVKHNLERMGYCAAHDLEEIGVKNDNRFNEQYQIESSFGYSRWGAGSYRATCWPRARRRQRRCSFAGRAAGGRPA